MNVIKRSGRIAKLDTTNIRKQTEPACDGLKNVSFEKLELTANISFTDGMRTSDIQEIYIQSALSLNDVDAPDWTFVAARLKLYDLYHKTRKVYKLKSDVKGNIYKNISIIDYIEMNILSYDAYDFDLKKIEQAINHERDKLLTYLGVDTMINRYLLKNIQGEVTELPQHFFMSLAMFLASKENKEDKTNWAIKFYNQMSLLKYLPATSTLANGRKLNGNCMSCAVGSTPDNLTGIFDAFAEQAQGSKFGTGFGWDWTRVRALGGIIDQTRDASGGLVPWMKIENDIAVAVDQLGTRLGAIAVSIETWHKDILDYLDLKKNSGEEKRRAKELFLQVSASDVFMDRVQNNDKFTLFDPHDVLILTETYGDKFQKHYEEFEKQFREDPESFTNKPVEINAKDLYKKIQNYYWETGMPFWFFKDNANRKHKNRDEGIIRSSNLCTEIFQSADENKTILCNLGSINLAKVNTKEQIEEVIPLAMRMLDNVVDLNYYAIPKSEDNQRRTRAVGLGIAGEAELIANKQIMYGSDEHKKFIKHLYSMYESISDQASVDLGEEKGTWKPDSVYRNAYRRAIAPTSSVSILMGTTAMHECAFQKVWIEENKMGAFKVTAPNITPNNYQYYVSPYDVNQDDMIECTSIRQKYVDQGISHNIYYRPGTSGKQVFDTIMKAWRDGLKSLYYLRSEGLDLEEDTKRDTTIKCFGCEG